MHFILEFKDRVFELIDVLPGFVQVFLVAALPVFELRGSIPYGLFRLSMEPWSVFILSLLGNMMPVFFVLFFLNQLDDFLRKRSKKIAAFFDWLYQRTRKRGEDKLKKWGDIALITIVAIPLPMTGAWTGSILAVLLEVPIKRAARLIFVGVLIAALIVMAISVFAKEVAQGWI
ncbi:MAG: ligand-binding protein SH3 [Candidatus Moranbacteria bacterium]|nr:ligand-binding protein SH3 [Candidatus Moranbacteria bacterium]